jgi:O-acetylhomoserine/O-acetylserine sulfhydrylase-like pyridoxal-dependent enzyme
MMWFAGTICMEARTGYFTKVFEKFGIKFIYVNTTNVDNIKKPVTDKTNSFG